MNLDKKLLLFARELGKGAAYAAYAESDRKDYFSVVESARATKDYRHQIIDQLAFEVHGRDNPHPYLADMEWEIDFWIKQATLSYGLGGSDPEVAIRYMRIDDYLCCGELSDANLAIEESSVFSAENAEKIIKSWSDLPGVNYDIDYWATGERVTLTCPQKLFYEADRLK